jgi:hypothetical protein
MSQICKLGQDGFYFPSEECVLRIFFALKNPTVSAGYEPANFGTKGQYSTSRPPQPLHYYIITRTSISNCVHHTCEYSQLPNRSNHFDTRCIYICVCVCVYVCIYIYMYIYIYIQVYLLLFDHTIFHTEE